MFLDIFPSVSFVITGIKSHLLIKGPHITDHGVSVIISDQSLRGVRSRLKGNLTWSGPRENPLLV